MDIIELQAGTGAAVRVGVGQILTIFNTFGQQVVDTWCFNLDDLSEFMSMEHSRSCLDRMSARVGESMYTNRRRPIVTIVRDTSPGRHDTLLSACDQERYRRLGHVGYHRSCAENFHAAMAEFENVPHLPSPWNLFEKVDIRPDGGLAIQTPEVVPGALIALRAEMPLVAVMSACPMDIADTNGGIPKSVAYSVGPADVRPAEPRTVMRR